jgi:hypothetical protein
MYTPEGGESLVDFLRALPSEHSVERAARRDRHMGLSARRRGAYISMVFPAPTPPCMYSPRMAPLALVDDDVEVAALCVAAHVVSWSTYGGTALTDPR